MRIRPNVALLLIFVAATAAVGCGGSSSPGSTNSQQVHGTVLGGTQNAVTVLGATGGGNIGACGGAVAGTQVIVKGPSGTLLATTNLQEDVSATKALNLPASLTGPGGQLGVYDFTTSIPAGTGPYTIDVVGVSSLVVSAAQLKNLHLTCS